MYKTISYFCIYTSFFWLYTIIIQYSIWLYPGTAVRKMHVLAVHIYYRYLIYKGGKVIVNN